MTGVSLLCPECGRVEVRSHEITLYVRVKGKEQNVPQFGRAFFGLRCPECRIYFTRDADAVQAQLLIGCQVPVFTWSVPAEMTEPHQGPSLVLDDLIDLHFELETMSA